MPDELTAIDVLNAGLKALKYDGLTDGEDCWCASDDPLGLVNCAGLSMYEWSWKNCLPGYKVPCDCPGEKKCAFHIGLVKPKEDTDA